MVARVRRDQLREFWLMLRAGVPPGDASARLGFGSRAGYRWLAQSGGMPPISLQDSKGKPSRLTIAEREEILAGMSREESVREIGRRIGRHHTTVSREIARNLHHQKYPRGSNKRGYVTQRPWGYSPHLAQLRAARRAQRPKPARLATNLPAAPGGAGSAQAQQQSRTDRQPTACGLPR